MSFLAARSGALLRRGAAPLGRRMMSGDAAEAAIEMAKWTKYSYGAIAFCGVLSTYIGIVSTAWKATSRPPRHRAAAATR